MTSTGLKVAVCFGAALAMLLVALAASYESLTTLPEYNAWVTHTHQVLEKLEQTLSLAKDVETSARGFMLTGDERFLEPREEALTTLPRTVSSLQALVSDNASQEARLDELNHLISQRINGSERFIRLRHLEAHGSARDQPMPEGDESVMDQIRARVAAMEEIENKLLEERDARAKAGAERARITSSTGGVLAVLLVVLSGIITWRDMQARKRAETALRDNENKLSRLIETVADGIFLLDADGSITFANTAGEKILGVSRETILRRTHDDTAWDITRPNGEPFPASEMPLTQVLASGETVHDVEMGVSRPDGSRTVISVTAAPLHLADGTVSGAVVSATDVTRRKAVELIKEQFISTISHELRTPLSSLRGFAELMLAREFPREKQREFLKIIHDESLRLTNLINDFLDLQRMEGGHQSYEFAALDVHTLMNETCALFATNTNVELEVERASHLPCVCADSARLRQVLTNLLSNAIKFSPRGGKVSVGARRESDKVVFHVSDQGIGMSPDTVAKLFTRFFRAENSETRSIGGTGLGLALVKEIVEAHRGRVWVESTLGQGSTFYFSLPVVDEPQPALPAQQSGHSKSHVPHSDILLVEDDPAFVRLLTERFQIEGLSVCSAANGADALMLARQHSPALGIIDIHLNGPMDGWQVLVAMKADPMLRKLPTLIVSASETIESRGLAVAGADYIVKPVSPARLLEIVRQYLPTQTSKRVLVADDDSNFRRQVIECLAEEKRLIIDEARNGREALERMNEQFPDLLLLDLLMPECDGFEVLAALRSDVRAVNLPVLVITGQQLSPEDRARIKRRMASLVRKQESTIDHIAGVSMQMLASREDRMSAADHL